MMPRHRIQEAIQLRDAGWRCRQVDGRRVWSKGKGKARIDAKSMDHAWNLEVTLCRTLPTAPFMYGPDIAELITAHIPDPPAKARKNKVGFAVPREGWSYVTPTGQLGYTIEPDEQAAEWRAGFAYRYLLTGSSNSCDSSEVKAALAAGYRAVRVVLKVLP